MANAGTDESRAKSVTAILGTDGSTIEALTADPTLHALLVDDGTTGSNNGPSIEKHDDNHVPTLYALSSTGDGTRVPLYASVNGNNIMLMTKHT